MKVMHKLLAMTLAFTLALNMSGVTAIAATPTPPAPCANHVQHDEACGYSAEPALPCGHTCEECTVVDSSSPDAKPKTMVAAFDVLDSTSSIYPVGTAQEDLGLPKDLGAVTPEGTPITVAGVTWGSEPAYAPDTMGDYLFTAVLPDGYELESPDIAMPAITVTLGDGVQFKLDPVTGTLHTAPTIASRSVSSTLPADGFSSFGAQLTATSKTVYDALVRNGLKTQNQVKIVIPLNITWPTASFNTKLNEYFQNTLALDFFDALGALDRDRTEIFWLANSQQVGGTDIKTVPSGASNTRITSITLTFTPVFANYSASQIASISSQLDTQINSIIRSVPSGSSDYDTLKVFHDWLVNNNNYNPTVANGGTPATTKPWKLTSALLADKDGGPVCEGYARGFKALCDEVGIPCILVSGWGGGPHMWNYVQLDGAWYPVDVTWDDPIVSGGGSVLRHDYFLIAGGDFAKEHRNDGKFSDKGGTFLYPEMSKTAYSSKSKPTGSVTLSKSTLIYGELPSTITLAPNFTYSGTPVPGTVKWQTPTQRLGVGTQKLTWVFTPNNTATYATVTGTSQITVNKKPTTITMTIPTNLSYTGAAQGLNASYATVFGDMPKVTITYNGSTTKPVNAGTYAVVAKLADNNYSAANVTGNLIIKPKNLALKNTTLSIANGYTLVKKVPLTQFGIPSDLFAKAKVGTVTDSNSILDGAPTIANGELSVKLKVSSEIGQKLTIQVTAADSNYTVTPSTLTVTVTPEGYTNTLLNAPTTVNLGEDIVLPAGFALNTKFDSGKPDEKTTVTNAMLKGYDKAKTGADSIGKKIITVTVDKNRNATFEIEVLDVVTDLIVTPPTKLRYDWQTGTKLDLAGGSVTAVMKSTVEQSPVGMTVEMLSITDKTIGNVGNYPVNVTYRGKTKLKVFTITVDASGNVTADPADLGAGRPGVAVVVPKDDTYDPTTLEFVMEAAADSVQQEFAAQLKNMSAFVPVEVYLQESGTSTPANLPKGSKITVLFPYPVGTSASGNNFKVLHKVDGTIREEKFSATSRGIEVTTDSLSPFAIAYNTKSYSGGGDNSSDSGVTYFDYDGYDFWMNINDEIEDAKSGTTIKVDAKGYDKVPWNVLETLRGKDNVTLRIKWNGVEIVIPSGKVLAYDGYIYYPLSLLYERYKGASTGNFNPETGGVMEFVAPKEAENLPITPKNRGKDISLDAEQKLDSIEDPAMPILTAEDTIHLMRNEATKPVNVPLVVALVLALVSAAGGAWFYLSKKKAK